MVTILSEDAVASKWVGRELGFAEIRDIPIIPIIFEGNLKNSIPLRLVNHQIIDARQDFDDGIQTLVKAIRRNLPKR